MPLNKETKPSTGTAKSTIIIIIVIPQTLNYQDTLKTWVPVRPSLLKKTICLLST